MHSVRSAIFRAAFAVIASLALGFSGEALAGEPIGNENHLGLYDVSQLFVAAYNARDVDAVETMLSRRLKDKYSRDDIGATLANCRTAFSPKIIRTSLPVSGSKLWGFFAVYGEHNVTSMLMEVSRIGKILHFSMADDLFSGKYKCGLFK